MRGDMKWPIAQIKAALDERVQRRSVKDLLRSGRRSVRVISEETVLQIIQAVVDDAIANAAGTLDEAERERIAGQAKEQFDKLMHQYRRADKRVDPDKREPLV